MKGITIFDIPIPVIIKEGDKEIEGYAIYAESGGQYENDCWTCVQLEGGVIRHYTTDQLRIYKNSTYGIKKEKPNEPEKG